MKVRCSHEKCFQDTPCVLGHRDRTACEHFTDSSVDSHSVIDAAEDAPASDVPWNGYALSVSDLDILGGRGRAIVIGLIGPPDSGKTSLLAYLYMWLLRYARLGDWLFAGSWTLGGWESIVQYSRWTGEPPPSFPPHTSTAGRKVGMLHIALRHMETGRLQDVMLTDAPGEWFTQWSRAPAHPNAEGARWVVEHADVLLLLVDSGALADEERHSTMRWNTRDLIDRTAAEAHCPVAVVWTKHDIAVSESARKLLTIAYEGLLPNASVLDTSVTKPETIEACFVRAIALAALRKSSDLWEPRLSDDPFLAFRGFHVHT